MRMKLAVALAAFLVASPAAAREDFPNEVRNHLGLAYAPPCSLCHAKGNTGSGTVVTPFGWSMRGAGIDVEDATTVGKALDALKATNADSDGDGVTDIAELTAGTDPNTAGKVPIPNGEEPGYGCGGKAPDPNQREEGSLAPIALVWLFRRLLQRGGRS